MDLKGWRQRLLEMREELVAVAATGDSAASTVELDQTRVGRLSRMDAMQGQAMSQEAQRRRELELWQIAIALRRIDAGDYGFCIDCDAPIAEARLEVDPSASRCIACADKMA